MEAHGITSFEPLTMPLEFALESEEEYLQKKIDEDLKRAKMNATSNKTGMCPISCHIP